MADVTMCISTTCKAIKDCRRNPECHDAPPKSIGEQQSYAYWNQEYGYSCPGFLDARHTQCSGKHK
jgi:hypothetical protein